MSLRLYRFLQTSPVNCGARHEFSVNYHWQNEKPFWFGGHHFVIETELPMDNWERGIIASESKEASEAEQSEKGEEEEEKTKDLPADYLISFAKENTPGFEMDRIVGVKPAYGLSLTGETKIVTKHKAIEARRFERVETTREAEKRKEKVRLRRLLEEAVIDSEQRSPVDTKFMTEMAYKAVNHFANPDRVKEEEEKVAKELVRISALKESRTGVVDEEKISSEYLHHPQTRMEIFFENASSMSMSEGVSTAGSVSKDFESLPSGSASMVNELSRLERAKDVALLRANDVAEAEDFGESDFFTQRPNVAERMWMRVSQDDDVCKVFCSVFSALKEKAKSKHQQLAACKNCATIFYPFFPDDYHMHQISAKFKNCLRVAEGDRESLPIRALVVLAEEAKFVKREGDDLFVKVPRIVIGDRGHRNPVKYARLELCENSNVTSCESISKKTFKSRNLAVGILNIVIQLHMKIPIPARLIVADHHGAGIADYFQRYRHLVPDFKDEILFRCFLVEFGQHVRRTIAFDAKFKYHTNWWSGRLPSVPSHFVESGSLGVLVLLGKDGLVQLANSLAEGTLRVLDDFCNDDSHSAFLGRKVLEENKKVQSYLEAMPPWQEDEELEKNEVPVLRPLEVALDPEARNSQMKEKISKTKLAKRPPLTPKELKRREQNREAKQSSRKKANAKKATGGKLL